MTGGTNINEGGIADAILAHAGYAERVVALAALSPEEVPVAATELLERCHSVLRADPHEGLDRARLALSAASACEQPSKMLAAASALAQALVVLGRFAEAVSAADAALRRSALSRLADSERRELEIVRVGALANLERYADARSAATVILQRCEREKELRGRIWLRMILADIDYRQDLPREALRRYREIDAILPATARPTLRAAIATNRGNALAGVQRFQAADRCFRLAKTLFSQAGGDHEAARADYNAAYVELSRGLYESALRRYDRVGERFRELVDERHLAHVDLDRSEIHVHLGLGDDARRLAQAARTRFDGLGLRKESAMASLLAARGALLSSEFSLAEADLAIAAAAFDALGLPERRLSTAVERATAALATGSLVDADAFIGTASGLVGPKTSPSARGALELIRSRLALARGLPAAARAALGTARAVFGRAVSPWAKLDLLWLDARVAVMEGRDDEALATYAEAIDVLERYRGGVPPDEYMTAFLAERADLYREIVDLLVRRGEVSVAFHYVERSKARALIEILARRPSDAAAAPGEDDASRRVSHLRERLNSIYRRLAAVREDGGRGLRATERDLVDATRIEDEMARLLRDGQFGRSADSSRAEVQAPTVVAVQRELDERTTLLQYSETRGGLVVFVVTRDAVRVVRRDLRPGELVAVLRRFRFHVSESSLGVSGGNDATKAVFAELSSLLVAPVAPFLAGERLVVVPSGALHDIPFHALDLGAASVVDRFEVVYAPSAAVYVACGRRRALATGVPTVLALPDAEAPRIADEARRAGEILGATVHMGPAATFARFSEACRDARIVHVATHGMFRRANPSLSSMGLADRWVNLYDVYGLDVRGELVVLSTCESGTPEVSGGDEVLGLLRGFLCAGARALLTTQWRVDDVATEAFMDAFYGALASGQDAAAAHRLAVLEVRRAHPRPSRWGAFFLTGHPVPGSSMPERVTTSSNGDLHARFDAPLPEPVLSESRQ